MLSQEQAEEVKEQIMQQIENSFPEDKKESAKKQLLSMSSEELEKFLGQNKLLKESPECIFCSIASGKADSYKIDEDEEAVVVLEINPISRGHILIIPKKHFLFEKKIPKKLLSFAKEVSEKIEANFKPKKVDMISANLFGHSIINLIPIYNNESIETERYKASPEELEESKRLITKKEKAVKKPRTKKIKEKLWLPKRIP